MPVSAPKAIVDEYTPAFQQLIATKRPSAGSRECIEASLSTSTPLAGMNGLSDPSNPAGKG